MIDRLSVTLYDVSTPQPPTLRAQPAKDQKSAGGNGCSNAELWRNEVTRSELMALLKKCCADADVIFCVNVDGSTEAVVRFVRYCVTDNQVHLYEVEPSDFTQEEKERDIQIYETRRASNFVETAYMEN